MDYKIISADDHIHEPRELFVERLPIQSRETKFSPGTPCGSSTSTEHRIASAALRLALRSLRYQSIYD